MKKKIRIGIVGFGKVGKIRYSILKRIKNIKIVAICEKNPVKDIDKKIITTNSFKILLFSPYLSIIVSISGFKNR